MPENLRVSGAIHSLDHFTLALPDLAEAERFYKAFGLDVRQHERGLQLRTFGSEQVWADLVEGDHKQLCSLRFGAYEEDLPILAAKLEDVRIEAPEEGSNGIWFQTPDGLAAEVAVVAKSSPEAKSPFALQPRFNELRGSGPRSSVAVVKPRRLAHVAIFVTSVPNSIIFFQEKLGIRLSDQSGDNVAFMHGAHGSDHHLIALARSGGPGLHHCSWDVETISDVGLGAMQMAEAGYNQGWGLGRHILGSNYFHYVRDPWGSYCEYSADMDYIPAGTEWPAGNFADADARYQWGPDAPADFGRNYELETAQ